jgi:S-DNA-T family DNA segregation ATPase FtsK/SpoIIIE
VITNLADEASLVARMRDALAGEMNRRQELLRAAGNFVSAAAYESARRAGARLAALPALFVIVDEFSELLSQHPDFVDMFVAIGRLGRSLGIHLLLASQRLDEGRLRGLESHLSYRVCLKTLSANESRIALGVPDAHELPNTPGLGYLRTAAGELIRFQTAFVSGPCPDVAPVTRDDDEPAVVQLFTATASGPITRAEPKPGASATGRTVLQTVLDRLAGHGPPAREVWLPPLGEAPALDSLLDDDAPDADPAGLVVPIGLVDRPFEQRRTPLVLDLRGAAGNVALVGSPQSGKSTALATLVTALAATHDPTQVQLYCLDFGGGTLASLVSLPQVGSVANRTQAELLRRTISEIETIVARREALFRDRGIGSFAQYRQLRATGDPGCGAEKFGDVFLVIDGWAALCREFNALEAPIVALAGRGLSFGVHVVLSASRWAEIRPGLRDQLGTRIELRLGDPADSELDRRQAQQVPRNTPGRGLTDDGLHTLIALPRLDGVGSPSGLAQAAVHTGELLRRRHGDVATPPVSLLPSMIHRQDLIEATDPTGRYLLLGIDEHGLEPVTIDFERQPHLLTLGDNECGKTSVLRTLCREIARTHTPEQAQLVVVDYRRSLLGVVDTNHLGGYAMSGAALSALLPELLKRLTRRMPGPEITGQQLRDRSWWSGPQLYLLVDDYDLVATAAGNSLTPLLEYLPHASDVGLHVVVARRSGGAARAVYEPLLAALRDLGCMGLMMSAKPDEGSLIGSVRPMPLPPGRGTLVTRAGGEQLIQVVWSPPP